jgi:hypothetical protein
MWREKFTTASFGTEACEMDESVVYFRLAEWNHLIVISVIFAINYNYTNIKSNCQALNKI